MQYNHRATLAQNLRLLMQYYGIASQVELAKKAGIDQKTISNIMAHDKETEASSRTVKKIADYFGVSYFKLYIPDITIDDLLSESLEKLVNSYTRSSDEGRHTVLRVAENEARYETIRLDAPPHTRNTKH